MPRSELADEMAVVAALDQGTLAGVATDVFACEPTGKRDRLERFRALWNRKGARFGWICN